MVIEKNKLIINNEITDDMIEELIEAIHNKNVEIIEINTQNISSLALQQLFCIQKSKAMITHNSSIEKFFENITYRG